MADYYQGWGWQTPKASSSPKIKSKHIVIAFFIILTMFAVTGFALYGRGLGDPNCQCTTQGQASWNMGSVIMVLVVIVAVLILLWRPDLLVTAT